MQATTIFLIWWRLQIILNKLRMNSKWPRTKLSQGSQSRQLTISWNQRYWDLINRQLVLLVLRFQIKFMVKVIFKDFQANSIKMIRILIHINRELSQMVTWATKRHQPDTQTPSSTVLIWTSMMPAVLQKMITWELSISLTSRCNTIIRIKELHR